MEAFVYSAGVGRRLGPGFEEKQKILLEFGGKTLLEWHLERLADVGIEALTIITGFQHGRIQDRIEVLQSCFPFKIRTLFNKAFNLGSVLSLRVSLPRVLEANGPVLLMDGDVLYPSAFLRRLIQSHHPTALLIDREFSTDDDDPVLVPIQEGRPFDFAKQWRGEADLVGESIGFFKVDVSDLSALTEATERLGSGPEPSTSYDEVIRTLVRAGRFGYEEVTGIPWTEIDFPSDVDRANREILPAIQAWREAVETVPDGPINSLDRRKPNRDS
jgi:choline kinase